MSNNKKEEVNPDYARYQKLIKEKKNSQALPYLIQYYKTACKTGQAGIEKRKQPLAALKKFMTGLASEVAELAPGDEGSAETSVKDIHSMLNAIICHAGGGSVYRQHREHAILLQAQVYKVQGNLIQAFKSLVTIDKNKATEPVYDDSISGLSSLMECLASKVDDVAPDDKNSEAVHVKDIHDQLGAIINHKVDDDCQRQYREHATLLQGQMHERQGDHVQAFKSYMRVDKRYADEAVYHNSIQHRARMIKSQVRTILLGDAAAAAVEELTVDDPGSGSDSGSSTSSSESDDGQGLWSSEPGIHWFTSVKDKKWWARYNSRIQKQQTAESEVLNTPKKMKAERQEKQAKVDFLSNRTEAMMPFEVDERHRVRRYGAARHFFKPSRTSKEDALLALCDSLIDARYSATDGGEQVIDLAGVSTRRLMVAERLFQEAVTVLHGRSSMLSIPIHLEDSFLDNPMNYGAKEYYKSGNMRVATRHRVNAPVERLGDSRVIAVGAYNAWVGLIRQLIGGEGLTEVQLATWMMRYGRTHQTVELAEVQELNADVTQLQVDKFNQFCFLIMAKEQAQWLTTPYETSQLGMAVALARTLILIEAGDMTFKEAFVKNGILTVYARKGVRNSMSEIKDACLHIDKLYLAYCQRENKEDHMSFLKRHLQGPELKQVLTREQAHRDLLYVYGGASESEGEAYCSDLQL